MINTTNDDDIYDSPSKTEEKEEETTESTEKKTEEKELTLAGIIEMLQSNHSLIDKLLGNLKAYFTAAAAKEESSGKEYFQTTDRTLINIWSAKFNHHVEVEERLQFI